MKHHSIECDVRKLFLPQTPGTEAERQSVAIGTWGFVVEKCMFVSGVPVTALKREK